MLTDEIEKLRNVVSAFLKAFRKERERHLELLAEIEDIQARLALPR
jgi:hypothetical protein